MEWEVEELKLMNEENHRYEYTERGKVKIYKCEDKLTEQEKIEFVDKFQGGKLSYLIDLINKFNASKKEMPVDLRGCIKTVSLKAWLKRNDVRNIIDKDYRYGKFHLVGCDRYITYENALENKGLYDLYEKLVDESFHRQLKLLEEKEQAYFREHDERSILERKINDTRYCINDNLWTGSKISIHKDGTDIGRELTLEELRILSDKIDKIDAFIKQVAKENVIKY